MRRRGRRADGHDRSRPADRERDIHASPHGHAPRAGQHSAARDGDGDGYPPGPDADERADRDGRAAGPDRDRHAGCLPRRRLVGAGRRARRPVATIRGPVVGATFASDSRGQPTFLDTGKGYPDPGRFTVVIWIPNRDNFPAAPEELYRGRIVCVTGEVTVYDGVPEMEIVGPEDIVVS